MLYQGGSQTTARCIIHLPLKLKLKLKLIAYYVPNFAYNAPFDKRISFVTKNYLYTSHFIYSGFTLYQDNFRKIAVDICGEYNYRIAV